MFEGSAEIQKICKVASLASFLLFLSYKTFFSVFKLFSKPLQVSLSFMDLFVDVEEKGRKTEKEEQKKEARKEEELTSFWIHDGEEERIVVLGVVGVKQEGMV